MSVETIIPEEPQPQGEDVDYFTPESVLRYVRQVAARRDPELAHHYRTMSSSRVKAGIYVALQILDAHLELKRRAGRGARTGRRKHAADIRRLLESTNTSNLVLAQAYLESGLGALPLSRESAPE